MKKLISILLLAALCMPFVSCEGGLPGIGYNTGSLGSEAPPENISETTAELGWGIEVDWMDFVRIGGISYYGDFSGETIKAWQVGELIGEIEHNVKSSYDNRAEYEEDCKRDNSASFRGVGCQVFKVKDDEDSIAVLDGGKYYIYKLERNSALIVSGVRGYDSLIYINDSEPACVNSIDELRRYTGNDDVASDPYYAEFDEEYFKTNTLLILPLEAGWGGVEYGIMGAGLDGEGGVCVDIAEFRTSGDGDTVIHKWVFFITVEKIADKTVKPNVRKIDPLKDGAVELSYTELEQYMKNADYEALKTYEGRAIVSEAAVTEFVYGYVGNAQVVGLRVRYEPFNMYWVAEYNALEGSVVKINALVIRAADGKIVSGNR